MDYTLPKLLAGTRAVPSFLILSNPSTDVLLWKMADPQYRYHELEVVYCSLTRTVFQTNNPLTQG